MSQNDFNIADAPGASARADINAAFQALASTSLGSSVPSTPYSGQHWIDNDTPSATVWTENLYDGGGSIELFKVDTTNDRVAWRTYQSADVASASTIDLDAAYGQIVDVTGTTTITAITLAQGALRIVRFAGALTLTHGASLVLPTSANITTAAGDYAIFAGYASSVVRCVGYFRANGTPVGGAQVYVGSTTFDVSTASGSLSLTGCPFTPKSIELQAVIGGTAAASRGFTDGTTTRCIYDNDNGTATQKNTSNNLALLSVSSGNSHSFAFSAFTSDGATLTTTKTGSPTGTATIHWRAFR